MYTYWYMNVCVLIAQLCLTLCDPMDCRLPGYSVHGILRARILEWVATSFSRGSSKPRDWTQVACIAGGCFNICATREAWYLNMYWYFRFRFHISERVFSELLFYCDKIYIWLCWILQHSESFSCDTWDLVPWPGIKPWSPLLGACRLQASPMWASIYSKICILTVFCNCHPPSLISELFIILNWNSVPIKQ